MKKWRIVLLYQLEACNDELSKAFDMFFGAMNALEEGQFSPNKYNEEWKSLRPNCSKVVRKSESGSVRCLRAC